MAEVPTGPDGSALPRDGRAEPGDAERGDPVRKHLLLEVRPNCQTSEKEITLNGLKRLSADGFGPNRTGDSWEEEILGTDYCDSRFGTEQSSRVGRGNCVQDGLTEPGQNHTCSENDVGRKDSQRSSVLVEGMDRLDLNHSSGPDQQIQYVRYESELQMPGIMRLITKDLSEPYSIYTYRYFIHNWPQLCFLAMVEEECVGAIVCKLDMHKKMFRRGYIAMLAVDSKHRRKSIGTNLVKKAIYSMVEGDCDEVVLETEITNKSALKLYENLGFVRDKRLFRYYLNGVDALRLKLWLR